MFRVTRFHDAAIFSLGVSRCKETQLLRFAFLRLDLAPRQYVRSLVRSPGTGCSLCRSRTRACCIQRAILTAVARYAGKNTRVLRCRMHAASECGIVASVGPRMVASCVAQARCTPSIEGLGSRSQLQRSNMLRRGPARCKFIGRAASHRSRDSGRDRSSLRFARRAAEFRFRGAGTSARGSVAP